MRDWRRIPKVLEIIPWFNFIQNNTGISKTSNELALIVDHIKLNKDQIKEYWMKYPDLRLGQLLINTGFAPDIHRLWSVEEVDWLIKEDYCTKEYINNV